MKLENLICRVVVGDDSIAFESVETQSSTLLQLIESDKKFGVMHPKNGKVITYAIRNTDTEVDFHTMKKIMADVAFAFSMEYNLKFAFTTDYDNADIKMSFNDEANDSNLTSNTIAYMGYPMIGNVFYGRCVINKKFIYTHDGDSRSGTQLQAMGIQVQFPNGDYATLDLDKILRHEWGHGVLGLQHDIESGCVMSSNESTMSEFWNHRDLVRGYAKVPRKSRTALALDRIRKWFVRGSDR